MDTNIRDSEIITALKSFKPNKASRPNGLHPFFYQKVLDIGEKSSKFYKEVFRNNNMPEKDNNNLLYIIPKIPNIATPKDFITIGFCNTVYKLVTKIIVNRTKHILPTIIGPHNPSLFLT